MNRWKVLGLAGLAGVAAAGVIITREQRQRTQLTPEEIRARLHERLVEQLPDPDEDLHEAALTIVRKVGHLPGIRDMTNHVMGVARVR